MEFFIVWTSLESYYAARNSSYEDRALWLWVAYNGDDRRLARVRGHAEARLVDANQSWGKAGVYCLRGSRLGPKLAFENVDDRGDHPWREWHLRLAACGQ